MWKLLIIEDERWEREGLIDFLDWNSLGIEISGTACDGIEGIEQAQKILPDIIITDIKMPGLDGIKMSKKIKDILPDTKIIILTGYDDFKFAREAISLNANAYVLKPVEEEEMMEVIQKVIKECENEKKRTEEENSLREKLSQSTRIAQKKLLLDLFEGTLGTEEGMGLAEEIGNISKEGDFSVIAVKPLEAPDESSEDKRSIFDNMEEEGILEDISSAFEGKHAIIATIGKAKEILIGLNLINGEQDLLSSVVERLQKLYDEKYGLVPVIGTGEYVQCFNTISVSCMQARQAADFGLFWGIAGIVNFNEVLKYQREFTDKIGDFLTRGSYFSKQLIHAARSSDEERVFALLGELFEYLDKNKGAGKELICNYLYNIINEVSLVLYTMNKKVECTGINENDIGKQLLELGSIQFIRDFAYDFFQKVMGLINDKRHNKDEYIIKKVTQLVEERYMTDINLKTIAGEVFLSPNYLGTLFRKCTGKAFNDYLCEYRMEKAKELLKSSKNKVSWVAREVGMPNVSYFCMVFKNTYGIAPGKYQERAVWGETAMDV